jgi:integrase/recombinase XerD
MNSDPQGLLFLTGRFLEHLRIRNYSEQTLFHRGRQLALFRTFAEHMGLTQARQVTRATMINYQSYLFHYRKKDGSHLALGTQKAWLGGVIRFFRWLTREGLILYNPASDLDLPRREYRLPTNVLTHEQAEAIMNVPDVTDAMGLRDRAVLETLYSTGIRRTELCNLNQNDVHPDRGIVRINQGKGRKDRFVPIGERALSWIDKYVIEARPLMCPSMNNPALFLNTWGERMNPSRIGSQVHAIIKEANVGIVGSCHVFRHSFATVLLTNGCDIRHIQVMLGHASLETTAVYAHLNIQQLKDAHDRCHPAKMPVLETAAP